jgi:SAM-dependent methyltransferase
MNNREQRRTTFDQVAEEYDRFRPGYPERVADDVVRLSGIAPHGRILEIGSGTGKGTALFAARGYPMICLEPGANLARVAARNLAAFPNVRIEVHTFEEWRAREFDFDLVIAAQSFHFIDPDTGLPKVASLLRSGGALAIFGNYPQPGSADVHVRVEQAYARIAPEMKWHHDDPPLENRIDETGLFGTVVMTRYRWRVVFNAADYVGLMQTQSDHQLLPESQRAALLGAIAEAIENDGGSIAIEYETRLHLAQRNE